MASHEARTRLHRFTRHEYERHIDHGLLDEDDPIELLDGLLLVKEPQQPEPDVCVVRGTPRDYVATHPAHPALVARRARRRPPALACALAG
jgi:hypothetical protein